MLYSYRLVVPLGSSAEYPISVGRLSSLEEWCALRDFEDAVCQTANKTA